VGFIWRKPVPRYAIGVNTRFSNLIDFAKLLTLPLIQCGYIFFIPSADVVLHGRSV